MTMILFTLATPAVGTYAFFKLTRMGSPWHPAIAIVGVYLILLAVVWAIQICGRAL